MVRTMVDTHGWARLGSRVSRLVRFLLPLLAHSLPECPSVAQIQGQGKAVALWPWERGCG